MDKSFVILLFVSVSFALNGQQRWVVMNNNCNEYPYSDCGSFGGYNISGSSSSGGYDGITLGSTLSGYKPFYGIGAAVTESSAYLLQQLSYSNIGAFSSILQSTRMFSSFRIPVGTSDFATREWTFVSNSTDWDMSSFNLNNDIYQRPLLNNILGYRYPDEPVTLIFSVWTPPIWLKQYNQWEYSQLLQLNSQYYQGVADYWLAFLRHLKTYIISASHSLVERIYVTIQNEPFQGVGANLPGCTMSVNDQIQIIKLVAKGLNSIDFGGLPIPKLLVLDHNWDNEGQAQQIYQGTSGDSVGVAFHAYGGSYTSQKTFHDNNQQAEIHLTEFSGSYNDQPSTTKNWDMGNIIFGSLNTFGQSITYWNLALDDSAGPLNPQTPGYCTSCNGVFRISNSQYFTQPRFYTLGVASKCIPYGAKRINVSYSGNLGSSLKVIAYQATNSPNGVDYCVLINNFGPATNMYIKVNGEYIRLYISAGEVNSVAISV